VHLDECVQQVVGLIAEVGWWWFLL
jgi:hypothetical protein